jgi:hypothetical protein
MAEISSQPILAGRRLRVGSHIKVRRLGYYHHGIYVGRGQVIHYEGLSTGWTKKGPIARTTFEEFADGSEVEIIEYERPSPRDEIISRAKSKLREQGWSVFRNNCEHFATWCVTGNSESKQVRAFILGGFVYLQLHNLME